MGAITIPRTPEGLMSAILRARAASAIGAIELVLCSLDWPTDPALSRAVDRLVQLSEDGR